MNVDFEKLLQAAPSPSVLLDRDLRMVWANEAYLKVTGRRREEVIGRIMMEVFPSEPESVHGRMLRASLKRVFGSGTADHLPLIAYPIAGPDGVNERYWSATHTPVEGADGKVEFVLQNTHDVTDLYRSRPQLAAPSAEHAELVRRAEAVTRQNLELDSAAEFFRLVFSQAPTFMAILTGPEHVFRIVNDAYLRVVGQRNLIGRPVRAAMPDVEGQGFYELLDQVYRTGRAVTLRGASIVLRRNSGEAPEQAFLDFVYQPLFDAEGATTGIFVQGHDVTAQKIAEMHLREAEERFRTMAQTMPAHVWTAQPDGGLDWLSDRLLSYTGRRESELYGSAWSEVVHPEDCARSKETWAEALASGTTYETEFRIRRADGTYRWHLVRATPIRGADGAILRWVGTNADIHDQKAAAEALANLNATLEQRVEQRNRELEEVHARLRQSQKMEAIGNLSGGIAHDFNNLLQAITGSLTLAARDLPEATPARERIDAAMRSVERGASLSSQLLAFSRLQPLQPKPIDLRVLLREMDHMLRSALGDGVELEIRAPDGLWPTFADAANTESALLNLAMNARDAMDGHGRLKIELGNRTMAQKDVAGDREMRAGDYVEMRITDDGRGMSAEVAERVFDPFFTTKPVGKGTGLGLATVYGFARQSGGRVTIESVPGAGTTVTLMLPRSERAAKSATSRQDGLVPGGHETILLVEDDAEVRVASAALLADLGYTVQTASRPEAALEAVRQGGAIDLVISDVVMPGELTSREMVERIQIDRPGLPALFVSGYSRDAIAHDGRVDEDVQFLSKPFSQKALAAKVREVLGAASDEREREGKTQAPAAGGAAPRVLVCEDETVIRMDLADMLSDMGAQVTEAASAEQALGLLNAHGFDVLMTDVGLPDFSGEELARRAREIQPHLALIFATGQAEVAAADSLSRCAVLLKPFGGHAVAEAMARVGALPEPSSSRAR